MTIGDGISTVYAHGSEILVEVGDEVTQGTPVLKVGSTGVSTGPHAHIEVRINGSFTNPKDFFGDEVITDSDIEDYDDYYEDDEEDDEEYYDEDYEEDEDYEDEDYDEDYDEDEDYDYEDDEEDDYEDEETDDIDEEDNKDKEVDRYGPIIYA